MVNKKKYIGQSKNPQARFREHLWTKDELPIHRAIKKYGKDNFELSILESNITNYNEREQYWIHKLGTRTPDGYNATDGGEGYPHFKGSSMYNSKLSNEDVENIYEELSGYELTINEIAEKHKVKPSVIYGINYGTTYINENVNYPIRDKNHANRFILEMLLTQKYTIKEISNMIYTSIENVKDVNNGKSYRQENISYPIIKKDSNLRGNNFSLVDSRIREELKNDLETDYNSSLNELAKKYNTSSSTVKDFNNGRRYYNEKWDYPLRKFDARFTYLSQETVEKAIELLKNPNYQQKDICEILNISKKNLEKINFGKENYVFENCSYPIRKKHKKKHF